MALSRGVRGKHERQFRGELSGTPKMGRTLGSWTSREKGGNPRGHPYVEEEDAARVMTTPPGGGSHI